MSVAAVEAFPAGEFVAEELDARGWTQAEFAEILGRPAQFVSEIIAGKKEITRESASQIGAAFETSAEFWLNLQDAYYFWRQARDGGMQANLEDVRLRARLKELAPVAVLLDRGFIKSQTPKGQERELLRLFKIDAIYQEPEIWANARRSRPGDKISSTQLVWIACVRQRAEAMQVSPYSREGLQELAQYLPKVLSTPDAFAELPQMFADVGVRLVFVGAFPTSKMDACAIALEGGAPVIGISGRGKRLDKVLFTLLHEVAHVLLGHLDKQILIIDDASDDQSPLGLETDANDLAGSWVLPLPLPPLPERVTRGWVARVADEQGVHPIVVIGYLQNRGRIPWRSSLVKAAPSVTDQLEAW